MVENRDSERKTAAAERGSISIYFAIILSVIFVFNAVLIDFARMKLFTMETEGAVKAGVRSVLSAYNPELRTYGLFGLTLSAARQRSIFSNVVQHDLGIDDTASQFRLLRPQLAASALSVQSVFSLSDPNVFKKQVLEEMKYKAPAAFVSGAVQSLRGKSREAGSAKSYMDHAKELDQQETQREQKLDNAAKLANTIRSRIVHGLDTISSSWNQWKHLAPIDAHDDVYGLEQNISSLQQDMARLQQQLSAETAGSQVRQLSEAQLAADLQERQALQQHVDEILSFRRLSAHLQTSLSALYSDIIKLQSRWEADISSAEQMNQDIVSRLKEIKGSKPQQYSGVYIYSADFFVNYRIRLAEPLSVIGQLKNRVTLQTPPPKSSHDNVQQLLAIVNRNYAWINQQEQRRKKRNTVQSNQKSQAERKLKNTLKQGAVNAVRCSMNSGQAYMMLNGSRGLTNSYIDADIPPYTESIHSNQPLSSAGQAFNIVKQLNGLLSGMRDRAYLDEYALEYFNNWVRDVQTSGKATAVPHVLSRQEDEFILYGLPSCAANRTAAASELYVVRWAFNSIDALTSPKTEAGTPLLAVLTALAEGAVKATEDVKKLTAGQSLPMSSKIKINMGYSGYLRLFYLLQGNDRWMIARMQALIQLNTGCDLHSAAAYVRGRSSPGIKLWFVPTALQWISHPAGMMGSEKNGFYEIKETAEAAY